MNPNQPHTNSPTINIRGISKTFAQRQALDNIDLEIPPAQSLALLGPNAAGKSTLLKIIAGLLEPSRGKVLYDNDNILKTPRARRNIGVIFHKPLIYSELTVLENLNFFAQLYGIEKPENKIADSLDTFRLTEYKHELASALSRGMQQRLSIARAMLHSPAVILADEPFEALDASAASHLLEIFQQFHSQGRTLIYVTHEIRYALACSQRILVLDQGRLIMDKPIAQIDNRAFSADYLKYAGGAA